jgi:membrane fusion protein (multidrug efflux system)
MLGRPLLILFLATTAAGAQAPAGRPAPVRVATAETQPFVDRIEALGTLLANDSVDLTARVTEVVTSVDFTDGQRVKQGTVLVTMQRDEARALLDEATFTTEEARRQYERTAQLSGQGAASTAQLDEARRVYETARARQLAIQSRNEDLTITAPFDGVVGLRNISVGTLLQPGDLITTIDDDNIMRLDFSVPSTFLPALVPGTPIRARSRAFGDRAFDGEIRSVSSRIDPVTRTVVVRAELPNPELLLKPGLLMSVELEANRRDALVIPEESLLPAGRRNFVMVVEEGPDGPVARRTEVTIGARRVGEVEILEGLEAGQTVVTHGGQRAAEGAPLLIQAADAAETAED